MVQSRIRLFLLCLISMVYIVLGAQIDEIDKAVNAKEYPEKAMAILEKSIAEEPVSQTVLNELLTEANALENLKEYPLLQVQIYNEIYEKYRLLRSHQKGTPYLLKAAELIDSKGTMDNDWLKAQADLHAKRAHSLYWEYDPDAAIEEMQKALKLYQQLKNDFKIGIALNGLGIYYSEQNDSEIAIKYYDEAFNYFKKAGSEKWQLRSNFCKAVDLIILNKLVEAKELLTKIVPRLKETKHNSYRYSVSKLGEIEMKLENFSEAEKLLKQSFDWSVEDNNHNSIVTTGVKLVDLYKKQGNIKAAFDYSQIISGRKDSILLQIKDSKNIKAQEQLEVFEQKQIVKELEYQKELDRRKFQNSLFYTVALFCFLLAMLGFWIYFQRTKRMQAEELQLKVDEVQKVRENLLSAVTHELRTPLTLIVGQIEQLQKSKLNKSDKILTENLDKNASELLAQIDQLLHWKRTEANAMDLSPSLGDVSTTLKELFQSARINFSNKNLEWSYDIFPEKLTLELDFEKLKIIISNLLSNAAKYTPEGGKVKLKMHLSSEDQLLISVEDNGIGIPVEMQGKIFNWYQRAEQHGLSQSTGFGVGLALSKQLSKLMNGNLDFKSKEGKGATFSLSLPVVKIVSSKIFDSKNIPVAEPKFTNSTDETSCLIIEDHRELNEYLKSFLSEKYLVYSALDAEHGMELALEFLPDVIISDQMLPGKSGLELCKELKEHILTDHIPIIILTALNNDDTRHNALINRADAFITKPFKQDELSLTINNLIQNRRRLKIRFQKDDPVIKLKKDDPFIKLMISSIESNFHDSKYNVDALAKSLKISRAQLAKKSKALIDSTPSALIKKHRLDQAQKLLEQGDLSVSETAYDCGFSSPEYFSTVFKEHFQKSPKDFLNRKS